MGLIEHIGPIVAQAADNVPANWIKNCLLMAGGLAATVYYVKEIFRTNKTQISPQPLDVRVVEELHEQFASKNAFDAHTRENTARHGQIFNKIETVSIQSRVELERHVEEINMDRRRTLERLNEQFTFIRENIAAINRELKIRSEK